MISVLNIIKNELDSIGIPYEFMRWTGEVQYPYWVGEYTETPTVTEDGFKEGTVILTGTNHYTWLELELMRSKIEKHFPNPYGLRRSTEDGAVVINYGNAFPVPTGEADLKRIQVNLEIKIWKGAM